MASKKDYTKELIEEYNVRLESWGNSDAWGLTEFKMLEDLIYESSRIRINANTLKRFFHQRTSNPQMATNNALCVFLGYSGYAEFVMKKTQQKEKTSGSFPAANASPNPAADPVRLPQTPVYVKRRRSIFRRRLTFLSGSLIIIISVLLLLTALYWDVLKEKYENYITSSVVFETDNLKGASPHTAKITYNIPDRLLDDITVDCVEANGDISTRRLAKGQHVFYATFIYPGAGFCQLKYKGRIIRAIEVQSRAKGWSSFLMEDRSKFYQSIPFSQTKIENGYLTLPPEQIPEKARTDKLFVSYTYYADSIADGDNFIAEARVRNATAEDAGIPCNDIMLYAFSDKSLHGFALNQNCYSYLKFISSESTLMGNEYDLSRFNFDPSVWHIMRIEVVNKHTTFFLDGDEVLNMEYKTPVGAINELTLRFKGCGAVDYLKVMTPKGRLIYQEDF
ncbi:MAG: hypothetical protein LBR34_07995 [Prevotella sp.]|jgi:hypothetical protein|nr:hypothetical protein [Prevotella sp.]